MSTTNKKNLLKSICTANVGCGCGKPELSDVYDPKPKSKKASNIPNLSTQNNPNTTRRRNSSSSNSFEKSNNNAEDYTSTVDTTSNTQSSESEIDTKASKTLTLCPKIVDSVAVVKDSTDPYQDFRRSMMQMIMEKEIYSKDDLQELLNCFLDLNSAVHHDVIVQAFTEVWNEASISRRLELPPHKPCVHGDDHES